MLAPAVLFYDVVVALHVMAIIIAFGVTFAYPPLGIYVVRNHPRMVPSLHAAQAHLGKVLITPFATIALLLGAYLASDRDYWSQTWVTVPLIILVAVLGLGGAFFTPNEKRAGELAARDVAAAGDGEVTFSAEYGAVAKRLAMVGILVDLSILVAVFFMVAKPFPS